MGGAAKSGAKYSELKTETQFLKKLTADLISRFGDSIDMIAFTWMVYALTGSASLMAVTLAVNTLVSVLLSPFSAALITGWSKKAVIVVCDIGRGLLVILTATLYFTGFLRPYMVIVITGLNSTLEAFRNPAGTSVFPLIIARDKYALGTSLAGTLSRVAELVGMGLAGALLGVIGISGALLIDAATFLISAGILSTLKLPPHVKERAKGAVSEFFTNLREGFAYAKGHSVALAICGLCCLINFTMTPLSALQAVYVSDNLRFGPEAMSVIGVSLTVGMGISSFSSPRLLVTTTRFKLMYAGIICISAGFFSLAFLPYLADFWKWISLAASLLVLGAGIGFASTVVQISFVENVDSDYLARVSGIMSSGAMAAMPVASMLSAALTRVAGVPEIFLIFGVFSVAVTVVTPFIKTLRKL